MGSRIFWITLAIFLLAYAAIHRQRQENDRQIQSHALSAVPFGDVPAQTEATRAAFDFKGFRIQPLAGFVIRARVLSRENYRFGTEAELSPIDLALGWRRMADPEVYGALNISQGGRWYRYSWSDAPPIPLQEIIESSANMHLIPASDSVARVLDQTAANRYIRLKGWLVEVQRADGWHWRSSLSRSDSGGGLCELIFVEAAEVE